MRISADTKIAILVDDGFEQAELAETRKALDQAGAERPGPPGGAPDARAVRRQENESNRTREPQQ